jgi:predicted Zn-dependent protease
VPDSKRRVPGRAEEGAGDAAAGQNAEARKIFTDLLAKHPDVYQLNGTLPRPTMRRRTTLEGDRAPQDHVDKEPTNVDLKMALAELMVTSGDKEAGHQILDAIDMSRVKDPVLFINQAIDSLNAGKTDNAIAVLEKVMKQFPTRADVYYYRAQAYVRAKKLVEAKTDVEKFLSMAAPDARELADAKKLLEQLKTVK